MGFADGLNSGYNLGQLIALKELDPQISSSDLKLSCSLCKSGLNNTTFQETTDAQRESAQSMKLEIDQIVANKTGTA